MLSAPQAAREIAEGRLTSEELVQACLERIRDARAEGPGLDLPRRGARARAGARGRRAQARGPADRAAARRAGRREGHLRHRRHADRERLRSLHTGRTPRERRRRGREPARGRRGDPRQDGDHRVRLLLARQDAQSAQSRAHARRLLERLGRRRGRRHGAARARQPDQRLGDPARRVLRRVRLQADARADPAHRHAAALAHARPRRALRTDVEDLALLAELLPGYDEGDPDTRPRARIPVRRSPRRSRRSRPCWLSSRRRTGSARTPTRKRRSASSSRRSATRSRRWSCSPRPRGLELAQDHHGSRDGCQSRARVAHGQGQALGASCAR